MKRLQFWLSIAICLWCVACCAMPQTFALYVIGLLLVIAQSLIYGFCRGYSCGQIDSSQQPKQWENV